LNASFDSFRDVLKHPIRRKIILSLSEGRRISYVDLMHLVGVSNTGKFNYHLNILGDLIEKDENGRYCLSDKGRFAVQFLRRFEDGDIEPTPLPMFMKTFETRALSLAQVSYGYYLSILLHGFYLDGAFTSLIGQVFSSVTRPSH